MDRRLPALGALIMSEYQYYEFLAVDRPLTLTEQAELREFSSRARITATSFTNEYEWGDFRGDPGDLMRRYYDAHLYLANWGTHRIMLRLPRTILDPEVAGQYCVHDQVTMTVTDEHVIIDMISEDDESEWEETPRSRCRRSSGSAPPETCGRFIWRGCRPTEYGSATRTPSAPKTRTYWSRRCPRACNR